jgi:hypothetical protein
MRQIRLAAHYLTRKGAIRPFVLALALALVVPTQPGRWQFGLPLARRPCGAASPCV